MILPLKKMVIIMIRNQTFARETTLAVLLSFLTEAGFYVRDAIFIAITSLVLVPLCALIAICIKLAEPSAPVIFVQERYGKNRKTFRVYKFRTMRHGTIRSGVDQVTQGDVRVTKIGRYLRKLSFDELPQLINILKGEMALVGPRPHPVSLDHFSAQYIADYWQRYDVKPGLTGLAQIKGWRGETACQTQMAGRVKEDLAYIVQKTHLLDFIILFKTLRVVLFPVNAH